MKKLLELLGRLGYHKLHNTQPKSELTEFNEILKTIEHDLTTKRNSIAHAKWQFSENPDAPLLIRHTKNGREIAVEAKENSVQDIKCIGDEILLVAGQLQEFLKKHNALPPP